MIGVVIPVHNEEILLSRCLAAIAGASAHADLAGEHVYVALVLDTCSDGSHAIARQWQKKYDAECNGRCIVKTIHAVNVGAARQYGANELIAMGARWLAFTDADTMVSPTWLVDQLSLEADVVCGVVAVDDWSEHKAGARDAFYLRYRDSDGHPHIHGANMGIKTRFYVAAGGFKALACSEDVDLIAALRVNGARIVASALPRVFTSARREAKLIGGFSDYLKNLEHAL